MGKIHHILARLGGQRLRQVGAMTLTYSAEVCWNLSDKLMVFHTCVYQRKK